MSFCGPYRFSAPFRSRNRRGFIRRRPERLLLLGPATMIARLQRELEIDGGARWRVVRTVALDQAPAKALQDGLDLESLVRRSGADRIVAASGGDRHPLPIRRLLGAWLHGTPVEPDDAFYERLTGRIALDTLTPDSLVFRDTLRIPARRERLARLTSLVVAIAGLMVLWPLLALLALIIRIESKGPVLFIQDRIGLNGKPFRLFKFRTMHPATSGCSEWEKDNKDRITGVGRWLRRFRLDELPQLINVVRGDMNMIGPRPHPVSNLALLVTVSRNTPECGQEIPYYSLRTLVRPGITGWAQVRYGYANGVAEEIVKLGYDLYYVKHASLALDVRILLETVRFVIAGRRARPGAAMEQRSQGRAGSMGDHAA